ncbi:MAG: acyltransferase domain-containing protein [Candidatus Coatesbacteria bacterium]
MTSFQDAVKAAGITKPEDFLPDAWHETQSRYPGDPTPFLEEAFLADAIRYVRLPDEIGGEVLAAAAEFRKRPEICRLLWHCHTLLFQPPQRDLYPHWTCPGLADRAGMFQVFALLSGLPRLRAMYAKRGIPDDVAAHTMSDIEIWMRVHHGNTGHWGLDELGWLTLHFSGNLLRLGRLQFMHIKWHGGVRIFRHRPSGRVVLLAEPGTLFRADGNIDGSNGIHDEKGRWTAVLERSGGVIRGNPISEDVLAIREPVDLPEAEWMEALHKGDPVLDMHIPAGEPLAEGACRESFRRALEFWPRHFPELPPTKGFVIHAWLLEPGLRRILPPTANLVKFQMLFHSYPAWGDEEGVMNRIFGDKRPDLSHSPRSDTLRAAVKAFHDAGNRFNGGAGGVLKEHLR